MNKILLKKIIYVILAVITMGFALSFLIPCGFGTDSCSALNLAISGKLGMSFGNWQALINTILFLFILLVDRHHLGIGTLANMFLVGYACDFFTWVWSLCIPSDIWNYLGVRILIAVPALLVFILSAAVYMDVDLGVSPYDALPYILHQKVLKEKLPFRTLRILYDVSAVFLGYVFGAPFAVATLAMAFLLGPAITVVKNRLDLLLG